jgi:aspartate ammonia-lyase
MAGYLFDAAQNPDDMVAVSSELDLLARGLIKICQDFRMMSSGPDAGFGEIQLPSMQPRSSIMPGKINPVIPEFTIQLSFQVIGNHAACQAALDHGELDLNVRESVIVFNILDSIELPANAVSTFDKKCIRGFTANAERNVSNTKAIIPLLTELVKKHKHSKISNICKRAGQNDAAGIRALLQKEGLI